MLIFAYRRTILPPSPLSEVDPAIFDLIQKEARRQDGQLELIASENFTSEAILQATGSVFTNKYAEGYPGKRYYGGCEYTDEVENLARVLPASCSLLCADNSLGS